jgi:hypothetical protein
MNVVRDTRLHPKGEEGFQFVMSSIFGTIETHSLSPLSAQTDSLGRVRQNRNNRWSYSVDHGIKSRIDRY